MCDILIRARLLSLIFPLLKKNVLELKSQSERKGLDRNIINILSNMLAFTSPKLKKRLLKKIGKSGSVVNKFANRFLALPETSKSSSLFTLYYNAKSSIIIINLSEIYIVHLKCINKKCILDDFNTY